MTRSWLNSLTNIAKKRSRLIVACKFVFRFDLDAWLKRSDESFP